MLLISYASHSNHSWHIYLSSIIRVETVTPDQKECEHELEIVGDDASIETQGRHLSILVLYFGSMKFIRVSIVHELLLYQCLLRIYLMHYQPCLEHYPQGEYACLGVTNYMLSHA